MKIYIVCDFHLLQSKHSISQCNGRKPVADVVENKGLKFQFKVDFNPFNLFHAMNKNYLFRKNVLKKIKIDIIQLIQLWHNDIFELKWLSIHELNNKVKRIENEVRNWSFNQMRHKVCINIHCDVECFWLWRMMYISNLAS